MPFPLLSANVSTGCSVSELQKGKRQQYSEIRFGGECPIFQLSKAPLVSPFSAGVFQEDPSKPATRLNLDLTLDAETESVLRQLDDFFEKKSSKKLRRARATTAWCNSKETTPRGCAARQTLLGPWQRVFGLLNKHPWVIFGKWSAQMLKSRPAFGFQRFGSWVQAWA